MHSGELFRERRIAATTGVEEAARALSHVYDPLHVSTTGTDVPLRMTLNAVTTSRLTAGFMSLNKPAQVTNAGASEYRVVIPMAGQALMKAGGRGLLCDSNRNARVFMPGRPAHLMCGANFSQVALMISGHALQFELDNLLGGESRRPLEFHPEMNMRAPATAPLTEMIHLIDRACTNDAGLLDHPLAVLNLERLFIGTLLLAQPHNYSEALRSRTPQIGMRPVARAAELLRERPEHPWTITELAAEVSVSTRSLYESFRRSLQTTPARYLRELRLERAHGQLAAADPATQTVSNIASQWGFTHLGKFAALHSKRYGELPSQTLRTPFLG